MKAQWFEEERVGEVREPHGGLVHKRSLGTKDVLPKTEERAPASAMVKEGDNMLGKAAVRLLRQKTVALYVTNKKAKSKCLGAISELPLPWPA